MIHHIKKLSWPILFLIISCVIAGIVGISRTNLEVIIFKFLVFCPSVILVHLTRKMMFPYIDLSMMLSRTLPDSNRDAAAIVGVFLYYTVLIYALTQAI